MVRVVIIGNGITGVTAAMQLRKLKPTWKIVMISKESPYFFSRPALMYIYMGHMRFEDTKPYEDWHWEEQRIERIHDLVTGIDTDACRVCLQHGGYVGYDHLLVATGSKSNKFGWPGQDLDGVQGFYDLQDLESLERSTAGLKTAAIVGGGLIGIEMAECLHSRGAHVIMLARESSYWSNILPSRESAMVTDVIGASGIDLRLGEELDEIVDDGHGRVGALTTKAGDEIEVQLVGLTAGVAPNLSALEGSHVETGRGILVDEGFRTNVENVWAAGDCAEIVTPEGQRNKIEQLWYTGKMHGGVVAARIAGQPATYERGTWYNSAKFVDLEWHTYGSVPSDAGPPGIEPLESVYWEHADKRHCLHITHDDGIVLGMNAMGMRHRHRVWERWIDERWTVDDVLKHLSDANFDPEFFRRYEAEILSSLRGQLR